MTTPWSRKQKTSKIPKAKDHKDTKTLLEQIRNRPSNQGATAVTDPPYKLRKHTSLADLTFADLELKSTTKKTTDSTKIKKTKQTTKTTTYTQHQSPPPLDNPPPPPDNPAPDNPQPPPNDPPPPPDSPQPPDTPSPPDTPPDSPPPVIEMATANEMRRILNDMLGPLGPQITDQGAVVQDADHPAQPSLMERLTNMRRRGDVTKPPGPEAFHGTQEENARLWKTKMTDYLDHCGYPDHASKIRVIKMFLADRALVWFIALPEASKATTEAFWTAFDLQYVGAGTQYAVEQALMARKQEPAEDAETYITDVVTKANRLGWDQARTMQHLIAGLNNQLKPLVMMKNPADLQEACRVIGTAKEAAKAQAAEWQGVQTAIKDLVVQLKADKEDKKVSAVQPQPPPQPFWNQPMNQPLNQSHNQPNHSRQNNRRGRSRNNSMRPVIPIHIHQDGPPRRNNQTQGNRRPQGNMGSNPRCWTCNQVGHFQSSCPRQQFMNPGHYSSNYPSNFQKRNPSQFYRGNFNNFRGGFRGFRPGFPSRQGN